MMLGSEVEVDRWCGEVVIPPWYWRRRLREREVYSGGGIGEGGSQLGQPLLYLIRGCGLGLFCFGPRIRVGLGKVFGLD